MISRKRAYVTLLSCLVFLPVAVAQPKLIDAHLHYNGDPAFLKALLAKLDQVDGLAFLLVEPKDLDGVKDAIRDHSNRLVGFGEIQLDHPKVLDQIDRFRAAGFRGLGELSGPRKSYDDPAYSHVYARAERYGMFVLFHTGIVNRMTPEIPADISVDRMRATTLDNIARRYPALQIIGAHLGNPDYQWAAEIARWNPNIHWDLSGTTLIKKQEDYAFFKSIFWWSAIASPHSPKGGPNAFEKIVFGSDVFGGEMEEFDRELERYHKMLDACGVPPEAQANIFSGTLWKLLNKK